MTAAYNWLDVTARTGAAAHDLVGWLMWDPPAITAYAQLGIPNGMGWIVAWRSAPLGDTSPAVAAAATYSISPAVIEMIMGSYRDVTDTHSILSVRDGAVLPGLTAIAPGLAEAIGHHT